MIKRIKGAQGSWFAATPIGELPVLKVECWQTNGYHDPYEYDTDNERHREYIEAVKAGRVVMARYQSMPEGASRRAGYLGRHKEYFLVDNVHVGADGLTCRIIDRKNFDDLHVPAS